MYQLCGNGPPARGASITRRIAEGSDQLSIAGVPLKNSLFAGIADPLPMNSHGTVISNAAITAIPATLRQERDNSNARTTAPGIILMAIPNPIATVRSHFLLA